MKHIFTLSILMLALLSCKRDKIDFDLLDNLEFSPELELPLVKARLSLADVIEGDSNFIVDPDNALRLRYSNDSIFSFSALDFVEIPEQNPQTLPLVTDGPNINFTVALGTMGGIELYSARFYKGAFLVQLNPANAFSQNVQVEVVLKNATINGQPVSKTFTIPAGSTHFSDSIDLQNAFFDLTDNGNGVNAIGMSAEILNNSSLPAGQVIEYVFQFSHLSILEARGYFGQRVINIPAGQFDFDISALKQFSNGFYLNDPRINLMVASTVGVHLDLAADFDAVNNEGNVTSLNVNVQRVSSASSPSDYDTSVIAIHNLNSDIVDFLAALPKQILYGGNTVLNPEGNVDTNFIHRDSRINFGTDIDIPLNLQIENMTMVQQLKDVKLLSEDVEEIDALKLIFNTTNGFPFETNLSVAILDSVTNDSIDGFELQLWQAPAVDEKGKVIKPVSSREEVIISGAALDALRRSRDLRLRASVNSSGNGQRDVIIYTDYELEVKIAAQGQLKLKL